MLVVKPFDQHWALQHGLLQHDTWAKLNELNPSHSKLIKRLLILRYNYVRQYKMYTFKEYWDKMPLEEQLTAEASANYYLAGYKHFTGLQYNTSLNLLKLKDKWDHELYNYIISHTIPDITDPSIDDLFKSDLTYQLINPRTKGRNQRMNLLWYRKYGVTQDMIHASENLLMRQIAMQWDKNQLKNTPAHPLLLRNKDIPLPNYATFLTWYNLLGHQFSKASDGGILVSFTLPHIPMTAEHLTHGNPAIAALDANESISYRNAVFSKDKHGNINYGFWEVLGAMIYPDKDGYFTTTMMTVNTNTSTRNIARKIAGMIYTLYNPFGIYSENIEDLTLLSCLGPMKETTRFNTPMNMKFENLDYGMRLMSRVYNTHFMFDDRIDANLWILAYLEAAHQWITQSINKFNESMLNELVALPDWPPDLSHKGATDKNKLGVDLAALFNAPL